MSTCNVNKTISNERELMPGCRFANSLLACNLRQLARECEIERNSHTVVKYKRWKSYFKVLSFNVECSVFCRCKRVSFRPTCLWSLCSLSLPLNIFMLFYDFLPCTSAAGRKKLSSHMNNKQTFPSPDFSSLSILLFHIIFPSSELSFTFFFCKPKTLLFYYCIFLLRLFVCSCCFSFFVLSLFLHSEAYCLHCELFGSL